MKMSKIPQIKTYAGLPTVTAEKMKKLDSDSSVKYGIKQEVLMENAGKALAQETLSFAFEKLKIEPKDLKAAVFCGRGNNGGDGLVCARYLKKSGCKVKIYIAAPSEKGYGELVAANILKAKEEEIEIKLADVDSLPEIEKESFLFDILIDALLGISALGKPAGAIKRLIQIMNKTGKDIVAADIPSGISPDTGHHSGVFVKASLTVTFGFAKTGLMAAHAQKNIGLLKVADIGYPKEIIEEASR